MALKNHFIVLITNLANYFSSKYSLVTYNAWQKIPKIPVKRLWELSKIKLSHKWKTPKREGSQCSITITNNTYSLSLYPLKAFLIQKNICKDCEQQIYKLTPKFKITIKNRFWFHFFLAKYERWDRFPYKSPLAKYCKSRCWNRKYLDK